MRKVLASALLSLLFLSQAAAETQPITVLSTAGTVEVQRGSRGAWAPLLKTAGPAIGDRIRTGKAGGADFGFGSSLDGMARLGEYSTAQIESAGPVRWKLESGKMWVLWEYENGREAPFEIRTALLSFQVDGGAYLSSQPGRAEVRSFGQVLLMDEPGAREEWLGEGQRAVFFADGAPDQERLSFSDYQNWREWMTQAYRYKDKGSAPA